MEPQAGTRWFARHPRFHPHFTPTYASWINLVERWFAALETQQLRRGVHCSIRSLESAIREFIEASYTAGQPYVWSKTAYEILASIARFALRTVTVHDKQVMLRTTGTGH
jgi:transposase